MDITLHPDKIDIHLNDNDGFDLCATDSRSGITVKLILAPELKKELMPLQEEEKKKIADEAFEKGVIEGRSCQYSALIV